MAQEFIKQQLVAMASRVGSHRSRHLQGKRALVIPPAGPGSVGDAAMLTSIIRTLRMQRYEEVNILQVERGMRWELDSPQDRLIPGASFIDYGSRLNLAAILLELGRHSSVFCVGADILDGIYDEERMARRLELIRHAAEMGLSTTILGSSFSQHPTERCVALLRSLPASVNIFARDEYSYDRMVSALQRPIGLSADVAFLLEPSEAALADLPEREWIETVKAAQRPLVAINANNLHEREHPTLVMDYANLVTKLIENGCSVLLVPHDSRMERSDQLIADEIVCALRPDLAQHARAFRARTPGQLKALLAMVDMIVTGRMHAAIIAVGSHTPAMSFAYANKFEGFYRHLELDPKDMILSLQDLHLRPDDVITSILAVLGRAKELREHIAVRLGPLREAATRNFGGNSLANAV